jgi:hypothetical protein
MKKITLIFLGIAIVLLGAYSCKKGNIYGDSKTLLSGSYITLDSVINEQLDFSNPTATVSIKVGSKGDPVASVNIFVATGSNALDTTGWVLIKNVPYSDGVVLSVSTAELAAALAPNPIVPGTNYALQNQVVTKDGRTFSVSNTPSTYNSFPAYNMALSWNATAVCAFDPVATAGAYKVVTDAWADYTPGDPVTVLAGPGPNQINFLVYPSTAFGGFQQKNMVVDVDPTTGAATIASQQTGFYGSGGPSAVLSGSGFVFSCTGVIDLNIDIIYGGSDYGPQHFVISKN